MLKIKDNVDLKELEKYGLELNEYINDFNIKRWNEVMHLDENNAILDYIPPLDRNEINWACYEKGKCGDKNISIYVFDKTNEKSLRCQRGAIYDNDSELDLDTLYDLIKDGLVEKIEE